MIAFIHPFVDGNGRVARSIIYWYLLKNGYWLTQYISISRIIGETKIQYERSFLYTEYDDNDLTYFINYNLDTIIKAKEALFEYINLKNNSKKDISFYINKYSINENEARIYQQLLDKKDSHVTVKEIQNLVICSNQTARKALDNLCSKKMLKKISLNKKKYGYILNQVSD